MKVLAALIACAAQVLGGCGEASHASSEQGFGAGPVLPAPRQKLLATVRIAKPVGWAEGETPVAAEGLTVRAFATDLAHPRWLFVLPNGDVLVAESDGPGEIVKRPKDIVTGIVMKSAKSGPPAPNRISLLRDADGDGVAETRTVFIEGLASPFGMALVGNQLYVAATDALLRFPYTDGQTAAAASGQKVADLPAGSINHHWTKNVIADGAGEKLYVSVGSNSNVGENGPDAEAGRAAIWEIDVATGASRIFASGLRNPVGLAWNPQTNALWTAVNERDELGDDLVPDYITSVRDGAFYGWPYSYYGAHVDKRAYPPRPDLVGSAVAPDYAVGAHTASLGLAFQEGKELQARYGNGAFIGQHGSWNRSVPAGYKVIFVPFRDGKPQGPPSDVLTGFLTPDGEARGRPAGVVLDKAGALLVADDLGNAVWRVSAAR